MPKEDVICGTDLVNPMRKEAERVEEDTLHSAKGHFNAGCFWSWIHHSLGIPTAILATWAGIEAFSDNVSLTALLAFLSAALGATNTFLNPNKKADVHRTAGRELNALKNRARYFREIEIKMLSAEDANKLLRSLCDKRDELNSISPDIPRWAYNKAKKDIDEGRAEYKVDKGTK